MASLGTKALVLFLALCFSFSLKGQEWDAQVLQEGDLLFCCSDTANAITSVTSGVEGLPIDHVGVVHRIGGDQGTVCVIEAVKPAVRVTPLDDFVRESPLTLLGRVNVAMDRSSSVNRCLAMVGKPYDDLYLPGDSAVYCSELVQLCFVDEAGSQIFATVPMSFHDASGQVTEYWRDFYSQRGMAVPEGEPGTNPSELSRRPQITMIGRFLIK